MAKSKSNGKARSLPKAFRSPLAYQNAGFLNGPEGRSLRFLAEYAEPLARFRKEKIQDTVVFFGSARFASLDSAQSKLALLEKPGSATPAPPEEQPTGSLVSDVDELEAITGVDERGELALNVKKAKAAVEMARYYEEARKLAHMFAKWSMGIQSKRHRFVVTSGGGPGIMEAANRGAFESGAPSIGLNISLPREQLPNPYISPDLCFKLHYFAIRKMHLLERAKAAVFFPGGYGTCDELFEVLTLLQTGKIAPLPVVLVGAQYWRRAVDFDFLVDEGMIAAIDAKLLTFAESADQIWDAIAAWYGERAPSLGEHEPGPELAAGEKS